MEVDCTKNGPNARQRDIASLESDEMMIVILLIREAGRIAA